jgi:ribosome maturation factor RimP
MSTLQADIEARLAQAEPGVEVLLAEVVGGNTVRLFIDHPDGVSLALCERVSGHLATVREAYALEVSSPGSDRPLTKPDHFRRFLGHRARVRLREPRASGAAGRRRHVSGELVGAGDAEVTLAADDGVVSIPYSDILRSNLVPGE